MLFWIAIGLAVFGIGGLVASLSLLYGSHAQRKIGLLMVWISSGLVVSAIAILIIILTHPSRPPIFNTQTQGTKWHASSCAMTEGIPPSGKLNVFPQ